MTTEPTPAPTPVLPSQEGPCVSLELDSRPETPTLVRAMLSGLAELLSLDEELLDDLKTAISEACNNVIVHAYPEDAPGRLSVEVYVLEDALTAKVNDQGVGISRHEPPADHQPGVGIPVIKALAQSAEWTEPPDGGTEVVMTFPALRERRRLFLVPDQVPDDGWADQLEGDAKVSISPVALLGGVLGRLTRTLAAMSRFSLDRFSDLYLVTDAVAAHASHAASASRIAFSLRAGERRLELDIGPLQRGSGDRIGQEAQQAVAPSPLSLLSDQLYVDSLPGDHELLRLVVVDHH